jgi:signal transduction histidine kinase
VAITVPPFLWERAWFAPLCWAGAVGAAAALVLAFIQQRLHRRLELLEHQRSVERERTRIAKDLHDDLGGSLTEINMLAGTIVMPALRGSAAADTVTRIGGKSTQLVRALDEIVWAINPKHDSIPSLADYLAGSASEFLAAAGIQLRLDIQRNLPALPLTPELRHELFVAAKEALNNVVRHARAADVYVRFKVESGRLSIVIEDNGCGFDTAAPPGGGDGLANMSERLAALGGLCRISSRIGNGTIVDLELPLK